jgi:hypothetical protein
MYSYIYLVPSYIIDCGCTYKVNCTSTLINIHVNIPHPHQHPFLPSFSPLIKTQGRIMIIVASFYEPLLPLCESTPEIYSLKLKGRDDIPLLVEG